MKNLLYFCRVAESILCLLLFFSCSIEEQDGSAGSRDSESLAIIENARTFFETSIIKTRSESAPLFDLGNIVPDWDNAVISDRDSLRAVDVSFRSEYCLKVTRPKVLGDTTKLYNVSAWQKLVILENKETGNRTYAYVTLVPSHGYYRQHKHMDMNTFVQYGDKGDFTGHAIYTDATNNVIFRVNFYIDGVKKCGATILGSKEHQAANIAKMRRMLAGMYFKKKTNILTRSGDEWDIDGGWIEDVVITPPDDWSNNSSDDYWDNNYDDWGNDYWDNNYDDWGNDDDDDNNDDDDDGSGNSDNNPGKPSNPSKPSNPTNPPANDDPDEQRYTQLGKRGISKIQTDLRNGNVAIQKCTLQNNGTVAMVDAAGLGLNTNGIIWSCVNFLDSADNLALAFGKQMSLAGVVVGGAQTYIGFTDGDISTKDILTAISTALSAAGCVCAFIPGAQIVSGVLGVSGCVIGLVSNFFTYNLPKNIHIQLNNGANIYLQLVPAYLC